MTETTIRQAHFRVDARWLGDFIRNAYWYEHRHIYAKKVFDDLGLAEVYYQKILNSEVTLSNTPDGECYLTNKPERKAQKELKKQLEWLDKAYIKLENGRYLSKQYLDDYVQNEWRTRSQADYVDRFKTYSSLASRVALRFRLLRDSNMIDMLDSTGVTNKSELEDLPETEKLILMLAETDYRLKGLKPFPYEEYKEGIEAETLDKMSEILNKMDEIYKREYDEKPKKQKEYVPVGGKLPPLRLKDGPMYTPEQLEKYGTEDWEIAKGEEREESAFIDPKGVWWNVKFASHQSFANWTIWRNYSEYDGYTDFEGNRAVDVIVQLGWLLVNDQHGYGVSIVGDMNIDQYIALDEVFGNRLLRNGTVKALWRESPLNKEP
jgi:hypothetical protein